METAMPTSSPRSRAALPLASALLMLLAVLALLMATPPAQAQDGAALRERYAEAQADLARSPFQRPLLLRSSNSGERPTGEMLAVVNHPFATLSRTLQRAESWCELLTLPANVKRCAVDDDKGEPVLHLAVGRKFDQPIEDTYALDFRYRVAAVQTDFLSVQMSAAQGPMGTSDYKLTLEAVPLDAKRSFVRMRYAYANSAVARVATSTYLSTVGRDKVGFTVVGQDDGGKPRYVDGIQGVAERNTMRYFLAIESYLDTLTAPTVQRRDKRLRDWFAATERYPRQLHEMGLDDYLAMKHREARQQVASARDVRGEGSGGDRPE